MSVKSINSDLKSLLGEDLLKQIEAALKDKDIVIELQENHIPKSRFDEVNTQAKDHKARADKFEKDLADATKNAKSQDELNAKIAELTASNEKTKTDYEAKIAERERDYLLQDGLKASKAKNPKAAMALLDLTKLVVKDGKLDGLDPQLEALKKSDPYLFDVEQKPQVDRFGNPITQQQQGGGQETAADLAAKYIGKEAVEKTLGTK
ncbi:MAG: phage scaffolding protein [Candidatus Izemoplasmatales bacterium]|nr:phage scaffolding protein [Candidatus Izemoplasmatales bacterium]MDD5292857.1 phage scaffolding protein [Candidatus Izemoplasmatales bacterium]